MNDKLRKQLEMKLLCETVTYRNEDGTFELRYIKPSQEQEETRKAEHNLVDILEKEIKDMQVEDE